ncbi:hypothetical protein ELI02_10840 [Rhizobium leguminosarum]|uniref:Uncharacterized protein n=1 Tax=Rhizobium leguminosarum TaxID=384 RepID=A0A4Q8XZ60_RHILE|nr:hypothetical protein ELI40_12440 [Rhizobium leguminosarum]TAX10130.1 hypothetical protein ELI07_11840 [Rhizobium leguminosarum]TAX55967.1 hypothetical protein ELI01_12395 [Rhizobium leguminosarum]TAX60472.1 hypothetical protein ELI02_10840 [Rhizobium leguminosarum]TAX72302.1 hypothetical protein ELI03_11380 [Rhizobium leguminosarum]
MRSAPQRRPGARTRLPTCRAHEGRPRRKADGRQRLRLQRRASEKTRKGRCSTLDCCIILPSNRIRFKELCSGLK